MGANEDIGKGYKKRLDGYQVSPSDNLWDRIEADLDKKKKRTIPFWLFFGGLGVLLLSFGTWYVINNMNELSTEENSIQLIEQNTIENSLEKVVNSESIDETLDDFDKKDYGLHGLSLDIVHGLVFICFSDNPPSLESAKKELKDPMSDFDFENMKVAASKMYPIEANWKLSIENYQECYHCATAHPEYAKMHTMMLDREKRERMQNHMHENMIACGLRDLEIEKTNINAPSGEQGYEYSRTALFKGYKTGSRDGEPVAPLLGKLKDYDGGASDLSIGPFSFFLAYSDHVVCYIFSPVDQNNSQCEIYWLVRGDAEEGKDYNKEELMYLWDITTEADKEIIVNNRKGVESRYYQSGPFSGMERQEKIFIEWILRELTAKI